MNNDFAFFFFSLFSPPKSWGKPEKFKKSPLFLPFSLTKYYFIFFIVFSWENKNKKKILFLIKIKGKTYRTHMKSIFFPLCFSFPLSVKHNLKVNYTF